MTDYDYQQAKRLTRRTALTPEPARVTYQHEPETVTSC